MNSKACQFHLHSHLQIEPIEDDKLKSSAAYLENVTTLCSNAHNETIQLEFEVISAILFGIEHETNLMVHWVRR